MTVSLYQGDCLDIMPALPASSVDLILCDLPYGTTACKWDSVIPLMPLWEAYRAVRAPKAAVVLHAAQPFTSFLVQSNIAEFRYVWIWEKNVGTGFLDAKKRPLRCHEDVCVFYAGQPIYNPQKWQGAVSHGNVTHQLKQLDIYHGRVQRRPPDNSGMKYPRSVVKFAKPAPTRILHPTQKPVALMEYLIRTYTNPGDTVLDNCMGSGTTGVACVNTGRSFIGIEKDPAYFAIAKERIEGRAPAVELEEGE